MSDLDKVENILAERLQEDAKGPQTLRDSILRGIEVYAVNLPQTCLDSPTSRTMLADHLAGILAMGDRTLIAELVEALRYSHPFAFYQYNNSYGERTFECCECAALQVGVLPSKEPGATDHTADCLVAKMEVALRLASEMGY